MASSRTTTGTLSTAQRTGEMVIREAQYWRGIPGRVLLEEIEQVAIGAPEET
jgi:hypothetical protein